MLEGRRAFADVVQQAGRATQFGTAERLGIGASGLCYGGGMRLKALPVAPGLTGSGMSEALHINLRGWCSNTTQL